MGRILLFGFLSLLVLPFAWGQPIERQKGISFSNIAPGELESELIKSMPVKITFVSESGIPYAGVYVRIFNDSGNIIFKHLCEKPWLFLKLPEGDYNVIAVDRKKTSQTAPFKVAKEGGPRTVLKLVWPKEVVGY